MAIVKCGRCDQTYSKAEHLKRHQRSRESSTVILVPMAKRKLDVDRYERAPISMFTMSFAGTKRITRDPVEKRTPPPRTSIMSWAHTYETLLIQRRKVSLALSRSHRRSINWKIQPHLRRQLEAPGPSQRQMKMMTKHPLELIDKCHGKYSLISWIDQQFELAAFATSGSIASPVLMPFSRRGQNNPFTDEVDVVHRFATETQIRGLAMDISTEMGDMWHFQYDPGSIGPLPDIWTGLPLPTLTDLSSLRPFSPEANCPLSGNLDASDEFTRSGSNQRFEEIQSHWHSRSSRNIRLMTTLWHDLALSKGINIYCKEVDDKVSSPEGAQNRVSRWGFGDDCRQHMQLTLNSLTHHEGVHTPQSLDSSDAEHGSRSYHCVSYRTGEIVFPPTETCEVALEVYFHQFHPALPVLHLPTFSAQGAPFPLLFVICLLGFSILGTPSTTELVSNCFPTLVQLVSTELQSTAAGRDSPAETLTVLVTALLTLNLALIAGQNPRFMAEAEMLYINLISLAQWHGVFSPNDAISPKEILEGISDREERWHTWAKFECIKRLVIGLIEIDDWCSDYFSTHPVVRSDNIQLLPPSDDRLFHAPTADDWLRLSQTGRLATPLCVAVSLDSSAMDLHSTSLPAMLTYLQHLTYESNHLLITSSNQHGKSPCLEPWRMHTRPADTTTASTLAHHLSSLPSTSGSNALQQIDINGVITWHVCCLMLTANVQLFEDAAGRRGPTAVPTALQTIARWATTPTARRAVVHAAQVFKVLFHRRVSDVVSVHTVVALFKAALILSFYLLTTTRAMTSFSSSSGQDGPLELFDDIDWSRTGNLGMADHNNVRLGPDARDPEIDRIGRFIIAGGPFSITGVVHHPGLSSCRRVLLHAADLMQTLGKWKSCRFSEILHLLTRDSGE
ncbi:uncharacterized protein HMPREF1541_05252 [Cyphellophora europaea CBS 101466]|uniref:C2H2-type domain-containing protein n=1 Tax=Cyphellophora europaea (strain CBS 101466) TaxID=1220924 RepID=W2RX22_CYPE1|nr:uncharacterized protein HMPREF1541_05252 [Cyphellophora europaea CBS 101466]ETN40972.1 hypothetical protein HMPREF1541_05252 [Cyphellophora europaea CBS 101466]